MVTIDWVSGRRMAGAFIAAASLAANVPAQTPADMPPACPAEDGFFSTEVWSKVVEGHCLKCHRTGGDAEESKLVLIDPRRETDRSAQEIRRENRERLTKPATAMESGGSRLLLKATGKIKHEGEDPIAADSPEYRILEEFVRRASGSPAPTVAATPLAGAQPFFSGVVMADNRRLLRRVTLSLAGRLPTAAELAASPAEGEKGVPTSLLDAVMREDAFYDRLREGFNDIFLTLGYNDNAETVLSYDHFEKTRGWAEKFDLSHIADEKERQKARYKLYDDYRKALLGEPMKLIEHIVRNDRPFTEIVTADYIMVTPYSARGYGLYDEIKDRFKNAEDPFEYIPVRLKALIGRDKRDNQDSATGFYPHAGLLSTFQYLRRYPTTETNRNRQRSRVYFQHFLGVDVLELAARVSDAAAVSAKFEIPTMQASECVVCHKSLDPVAGLFQDYWRFEGVYGRRKEGWFTDMFPPGYEGENLPESERWRALQWLGERTAKDPRFAVAMVEHAYYLLTGRRVLLRPKDLADPLHDARFRAWQEQRATVDRIAASFAKSGFNFKTALKDWIASDFYRADGLATAADRPERRAELDDVGLMRLLSPEQLERKVAAVFGKPWGQLRDQMALLYGGIDSNEVTERAADPSGAMGAIQRILSNEVACKQTALDFTRPPAERLFFSEVQPTDVPGTSVETDERIRRTISHLHERILGRNDDPTSASVDRSYALLRNIVEDFKDRKGIDDRETYHCRRDLKGKENGNFKDPFYTVRAWRAVITFLLRQPEFLYE